MLISIETLITYDFQRGGGAFYCVSEHESFGPNIASVANWVCQDSSKRYELFLKSYCLLRYMSIAASEHYEGCQNRLTTTTTITTTTTNAGMNPLPEIREVSRAIKNTPLNCFPHL